MVKIPFLGKEKKPKSSATERVRTLSAQGFSEPDIIRTLRSEGYKPAEVDMALKETLRAAIVPPARQPEAPPEAPERRPPERPRELPELPELPEMKPPKRREPIPAEEELPEFPGTEEWMPPGLEKEEPPMPPRRRPERDIEEEMPPLPQLPRRGAPPQRPSISRTEIEEIVEGVVEEHWREMKRELDQVSAKVNSMAAKVSGLESTMGQLKGVKPTEVEEIKAGIETYRESMSELSERMEAMERAVKDSLTPMMQSLRSLSETIKVIKKGGSSAAPEGE
jgi:prefoldin subunit 5